MPEFLWFFLPTSVSWQAAVYYGGMFFSTWLWYLVCVEIDLQDQKSLYLEAIKQGKFIRINLITLSVSFVVGLLWPVAVCLTAMGLCLYVSVRCARLIGVRLTGTAEKCVEAQVSLADIRQEIAEDAANTVRHGLTLYELHGEPEPDDASQRRGSGTVPGDQKPV